MGVSTPRFRARAAAVGLLAACAQGALAQDGGCLSAAPCAGVELSGGAVRDAATSPVALGVALGLVVGKPIGIALFSFVAVRSGLASLPAGVSWAMLAATGMIAGIGFTVSLFISELAFTSASLVDEAKIGILAGSALIGVAGFVALRSLAPPRSVRDELLEITEEASA